MNEQEEAKTRLKRQQQELDHMKLRYLAVEEKQVGCLFYSIGYEEDVV